MERNDLTKNTKCTRSVVYLPKPLNLFARVRIVTVDRVAFPVGDVQFLHSAQHQLQRTINKVLKPRLA